MFHVCRSLIFIYCVLVRFSHNRDLNIFTPRECTDEVGYANKDGSLLPRQEDGSEYGELEVDSKGGGDAGGSGGKCHQDPFDEGEQEDETRERSLYRVGQCVLFLSDMAPFVTCEVVDNRVTGEGRCQEIVKH